MQVVDLSLSLLDLPFQDSLLILILGHLILQIFLLTFEPRVFPPEVVELLQRPLMLPHFLLELFLLEGYFLVSLFIGLS